MQAVIDFLLSVVDFIGNQIMTVVWAIGAIPQFTVFIGSFFTYCPGFLLLFLEVSLALTVLFAIIKLL